ncbi:MAG: hypothetical protein IPL13_18760 [Saprospiraceae bacterium]|jgi:hypothetical protein|uniref:hypothetical protein n=1 Tax=Candidatus Brachybacter algidus TaxID=2982024 RepID=UPI001B509A47|nr:hypothetical protein [Candidatus Brachybacter algidus]MBP9126465.1 hypothetical protein [Saprospiraceae bacterium]MBK6373799.1 hypothetical protein [Candidatus Brachybacter algidus]MBK6448974.1 hypothetical protein [Candidatus Brachybacter algidus]MBK8357341.1 hypothetical protein [Candidatus Brachybacter algidus]MBK8604764.1 hypothetical protein [Candidatus Brachybacter algidus]
MFNASNKLDLIIQIETLRADSMPAATGVWQKWRLSAPKTHLWLIKVWFSASTFVVKIATFAKRQTVGGNAKNKSSSIVAFDNLANSV